VTRRVLLVLGPAVLVALALWGAGERPRESYSESEIARAAAKAAFARIRVQTPNRTPGPCLADPLIPGYAADLVRNPRAWWDDVSENRCPSEFDDGPTRVVEVDQHGDVVQVRLAG
jgi:hypothetical protein